MVHIKVVLCLVLFVAAGGSFARSPVSGDDAHSDSSPFPTEMQESIKQLSQHFEKSFNSFTKNFQFMFQNLNVVFRSTVETGFVNVATWAFDIVGRFEFLVMADGSHFMTPVSSKSELEHEYKIVSVAVSKLLRNLKTMERTDRLITNATRKVITDDLETQFKEMSLSSEKTLKTILHKYIEAMDHLFEGDHELATEYAKQKSEAKQHLKGDGKMHESLYKLWEDNHKFPTDPSHDIKSFLRDKEVLREAYVNKLFMKHAVKNFAMIFNSTHHRRFTTARAMIHKAQTSGFDSKINQIYQKALTHAAAVEHFYTNDHVLADMLFHSVDKSLESDRPLYKEIHDLMKEYEGSTVYDVSMLRIDFAPL